MVKAISLCPACTECPMVELGERPRALSLLGREIEPFRLLETRVTDANGRFANANTCSPSFDTAVQSSDGVTFQPRVPTMCTLVE